MRNSAGKRLAALGLAVILPFLCAATWGTAPLDSLDLSDRTDYKLPVDLSVIEPRANEKAFTDFPVNFPVYADGSMVDSCKNSSHAR